MLSDPEYNPDQDEGDRFNLYNVLKRGLTIEIKKDPLKCFREEGKTSNACPRAEKLKLQKLLFVKVHDRSLNKAAKVALGAHDAFDHMFFFELIHSTGLAETILPKIGNFKFSTVDSIFSVPAEYVAMVAYDWRAWMEFGSQHQRPVGPILAAAKRTLRAGFDDNLIPEELRSTIESFLDLPEEHWTVQQFAFVLRGIQWENGEMAIKWGPLDLRPQQTIQDPHTEPWGPAPILQEPCYLALVICGLATLNDPKHGARDVLERINYTLEHELSKAMKHYETSEEPYTFELTLKGLRENQSPDVPESLRQWFKEHVGFASVREPLCA